MKSLIWTLLLGTTALAGTLQWDAAAIDGNGNEIGKLTQAHIEAMGITVEDEVQCIQAGDVALAVDGGVLHLSFEDYISCHLVTIGTEHKSPPISRLNLDVSFDEPIMATISAAAGLDGSDPLCRGLPHSEFGGSPNRGLETHDSLTHGWNSLTLQSDIAGVVTIPDQVRVITRCPGPPMFTSELDETSGAMVDDE